MKKTLFFIVTVICSTFVYSQKYVPFPTENVEWNIKIPTYYASIETTFYSINTYSLRGDTLINGILYKKVCMNIGSKNFPQYSVVGGLREEGKKIYYISVTSGNPYGVRGQQIEKLRDCSPSKKTIDNGEMLLYDFNAKVGDIIRMGYYDSSLLSIDSVKIGDSFRKRYNFNSDQIIEGIGSVKKGLLGNLIQMTDCGGGGFPEFICFSQNGETLYKNPAYKDCSSTERWDAIDYLKKGTEWYYKQTYYEVIPFYKYLSEGYMYIKSINDTLVGGRLCRTVAAINGRNTCRQFADKVFVNKINDTTYFFNTKTSTFSPLYVWSAKKGDSWVVKYPDCEVQVVVDSLNNMTIFSRLHRLQYVRYHKLNSYPYEVSGRIIEGIGDPDYYFASHINSLALCDNVSTADDGLRCYIHPDYGTYKIGTLDCNYVTALPEVKAKEIKVYINSLGDLKIESEQLTESCTFELMDMKGSILFQTNVSAGENAINTSRFSNGLYMYRLTINGKLLKAGKIVKM